MRTALILVLVAMPSAALAERPVGVRVVEWTDGQASFTPQPTAGGTPLHWADSCVFLRPHPAGAADVADFAAALAGATGAWQAASQACGYLQFQLESPEAGEVGLDYVNRVIVREDRWCRPGPPVHCYDAGAVAITTLFFVDRPGDPMDGVILDADLELNAVDYALATCDGQPGGCVTAGTGLAEDLQSVLTHELGHLIGLGHTCWDGAPSAAPLDGDGAPLPSCNPAASLPPEVTAATMYNFIAPEEIGKRTPEADDVAGWCRTYPIAADPRRCAPVTPIIDGGLEDAGPPDAAETDPDAEAGCCRTSERGGSWLAIALVAVALRRRRGATSRG